MKRMPTKSASVISVIVLLVGASASWAAKAPISKKSRNKEATHIVTGKVVAVTSKVQKSTIEKAKGYHRDKIFTMTVKIDSTTKGKNIKVGDKITVVAWKAHTRIPPLAGLQGHNTIPKKGEVATFYLKKNGTSFAPLMPNGIDIKKSALKNVPRK